MNSLHSNSINVGPIEVNNLAFLAPMSGVTDLPFRQLAHEMGAGLVFTEMVASATLASSKSDVSHRLSGHDLQPHAVQLVGNDPTTMASAARIAVDSGAQIIDINMGCPAREVTGKMSGSALMREPHLAHRIIDSVVNAVSCPVTLKMRLGWDNKDLNAPELAIYAQKAGVKLLTVHARTRCQFFKGKADWAAVKSVTSDVDIPVIINGDIATITDARHALCRSGADGVMIGRAAYGAPWKPGHIARALKADKCLPAPSLSERRATALRHIEEMFNHHGKHLGLRKARKHIGWYLEEFAPGLSEIKAWRRKLCTNENANQVLRDFACILHEACEASP